MNKDLRKISAGIVSAVFLFVISASPGSADIPVSYYEYKLGSTCPVMYFSYKTLSAN